MEAQVLSFDTEIQGVIEPVLHEDFGVGEDRDRLILFQLEPLTLPWEGEVPSHSADTLNAEDGGQMVRGEKGAMNIGGIRGKNGKALVMSRQIGVPEELIRGVSGGDAFQTQLFDEAVLQGAKEPLHASFGLRAMGMEDLDVQCSQGAGILSLRLLGAELLLNRRLSCRHKNAVFIHRQGQRTAFLLEIGPGGLHEGFGAFGVHEDGIGDSAGGIIDEGDQDTGGGPVFEPGVMGAVHLEECSITRSALPPGPMAGLTDRRGPQSLGGHELADSLTAQLDSVSREFFSREGGTTVSIVGSEESEGLFFWLFRLLCGCHSVSSPL